MKSKYWTWDGKRPDETSSRWPQTKTLGLEKIHYAGWNASPFQVPWHMLKFTCSKHASKNDQCCISFYSHLYSVQISPGLNAIEIQIPHDKHQKVSLLVKIQQNTHNSVKLPNMKY